MKKLHIKSATRYPQKDDSDLLVFSTGVNLIVGEMNTGKTKWLQMIDFVLGDPDRAEDAFTTELSEKYEKITLVIDISGKEYEVERRWKEKGSTRKIFVDGEGFTAKEFSKFILKELEIPLIQVPSGNPYSDRTWPELSWRELLRHMYKQELKWSDIAEKQPEVIRSACVLHFLNEAKNIYSDEYGQLISKQKEKIKLEAKKEIFVGVLQDLSVELIGQPEMTIAVTPDSVEETRTRLKDRIVSIENKKSSLLSKIDADESLLSPETDKAKEELGILHERLGQMETDKNITLRRLSELTDYSKTLEEELGRFSRINDTISAFSDLKVTHCPSCDQTIPVKRFDTNICQVCGQKHEVSNDGGIAGKRRIDFEVTQVAEEFSELSKLISENEEESSALEASIIDIRQRITGYERSIHNSIEYSKRAIPADFAILDNELGHLAAQMEQLDKVERSIGSRDVMSEKITDLEKEIDALDIEIKQSAPTINYQKLGDLIADRMNDFLNTVNADELSRWKTGRVSVTLKKDKLDIFLDKEKLNVKAGGTAYFIIQLSYHYALLSLSQDDKYNYPGFLIIDFPPHFSKADDLKDSESYLLKPFVKLCMKETMKNSQVIIAGRSFENLENAHSITI